MVADPWVGMGRKDRFIAKLASILANAVYRDIEVHHVTPPPATGPQVSVANHFGGVSDALLLVHTMHRRPGIVARDVIWRVPVAGRVLTWIGGIPVHKPEDGGDGRSSNDQMFATCYQSLRDDENLLIFPEGVTRNEPSIARVKTGAARIALGARASGAEGLMIAPAGIHYEDKAALRSRVVIIFDQPIDLDHEVAGQDVDADDRDAVDALTDLIDERLRRAAPDFADWDEARALATAAEIALRPHLDDPTSPVPVGLRDRLANVLADRPSDERADVCNAVAAYRTDLDATGLTDADLYQRVSTGGLARGLLVQLLVGLLVLPFALVGAAVHLVPYFIVKAVGLLRSSPSMKATIKPIVAILAFGATWVVVIWAAYSGYGLSGAAAAMVLLPVYLTATTMLLDRLVLGWRMLRRWESWRVAADVGSRLESQRHTISEAVLQR